MKKAHWPSLCIGALITAIFLWPIVGLIQGIFLSPDFNRQGINWRLAKTAQQFRPNWIPHTGHMLIPVWPSPDAVHDKGCLDEIYRRESAARGNLSSRREPYLRAAIGSWMWSTRDQILEPFELQLIGDRFSLISGAINGCIEGSIAAPLCKMLLRETMITEYDRARPQLERALQEAVNSAEIMACTAMDENGPLMQPLNLKAD